LLPTVQTPPVPSTICVAGGIVVPSDEAAKQAPLVQSMTIDAREPATMIARIVGNCLKDPSIA
jgi:hypothetical protein